MRSSLSFDVQASAAARIVLALPVSMSQNSILLCLQELEVSSGNVEAGNQSTYQIADMQFHLSS